MPDHIRFLLKHALFGALAALVFVGLLFWFDVAGLWHLVTHTSSGAIAAVVMTVLFTITFASVQMGIAIMGLGERDGRGPRGGNRVTAAEFRSIPVPVKGKRR